MLTNVTITNNSASAGGGIDAVASLVIRNSIVAGNTAPINPDVHSSFTSQGNNLVQNRGSSTGYVASDLPDGTDPLLDVLKNNGGLSATDALQNGSPAINAGNDTFATGTNDQRGSGFARIVGAAVDIGAFERQSSSVAAASVSGRITVAEERGGSRSMTNTESHPVEGVAVRMNGTQNRLTVTDSNGNYHFDNVETNGLYTITPTRANFAFSPTQHSFSQLGLHTDVAFAAVAIGGTPNPLDTTEYFVRQQYVDFLNREPDEAGLNFWINNIESCGIDEHCRAVKAIDMSAAFFLSIEFQQTGFLVHRTYQTAYGDPPGAPVPVTRSEFQPDTQEIGRGVIVNQSGWEKALESNKSAFTAEFVQRPRFVSVYPTAMTPAEFVDKLFANAGVRPKYSERAAVISEFGSAGTTSDTAARGRALRRVSESTESAQKEFNRAFVLMQYFGYLGRDPDAGLDRNFDGYNFWLNKLDAFGGNYQDAEMVKAFVTSTEYRGRFPR